MSSFHRKIDAQVHTAVIIRVSSLSLESLMNLRVLMGLDNFIRS